MTQLTIQDSLYKKYNKLANELDGFADAEELIAYLLRESARELQKENIGNQDGDINEEAVYNRLSDLGYVE